MAATAKRVVTGTDDDGNELAEYQFGADVDGVFVPFVTKSEGYVQHLVKIGKDKAATEGASPDASWAEGSEPTGQQ